MYFVDINAAAQVAIILLACGPCMIIVNCWDRFCTLGRAPRTKETLPDFHKWCWVTRYLRVFCGLTDCQHTPEFWNVTISGLLQLPNSSSTSVDTGLDESQGSSPPWKKNCLLYSLFDGCL